MAIKEKGYTRWDGVLEHSPLSWLPIFFTGIRTVWKKKWSKLLLFTSLFPFLGFMIAIYASTKPELKELAKMLTNLNTDAAIFNAYFANDFLIFMLMLMALFSGAELISLDLKTKALPLYFSRPLNKWDYLTGKLSIICFYLLLISLVPGLVLFFFKLIFAGKISISLPLLTGIFLYPLLAAFFLSALTLSFSILTPNSKLVKIIIFLVYVFSDSFAEALRAIFKKDIFYLFSLKKNLTQLGTLLFGTKNSWSYPPWLALAVLVAVSAGLGAFLYWKLRRVEALT